MCRPKSHQLADQFELAILRRRRHRIAGIDTGKAALRAHGKPIQRDESGRLLDAALERRFVFELRMFGGDQPEHDGFVLRHEAQGEEAAGARRVVFQEIEPDRQAIEQPLRHFFVAAFRMPMAAAIAAAKMHADVHSFWRGAQELICDGDIFVDQRAPVIAARGKRCLHGGVAEFGECGLVDLDITAARRGECVKLAGEGLERIGPELIHILVGARGHRRIAAAEMQCAGARDRDLRPALRMRFQESNVGAINRMAPLHPTADDRQRLCAAAAFTVAATMGAKGVGAADRVDAQLTERAIEEAVIGAAAEFAVGDEFEPEPLLQADGVANGLFFGGRQRSSVDLAFGETGAFAHQFRRTQQAADVLGTEWRLRGDCI